MAFMEPGTHVSKGPLCYYLDKLSRRDDSLKRLTDLRGALRNTSKAGYQGFVPTFSKHVFDQFKDLTPARKGAINSYLETNWFNEGTGWWPHLQPVEPTFCLGMIKLLDVAIGDTDDWKRSRARKALPIESYWVVIEEGFEMAIAPGSEQVNLFIMTPAAPKPRVHGLFSPSDTPIWVVKDDRMGGDVETRLDWERRSSPRSRRIASRGRVLTVRIKRPG